LLSTSNNIAHSTKLAERLLRFQHNFISHPFVAFFLFLHRQSIVTMVESRRVVQSRAKSDVIDRIFSWGEATFCPYDAMKDSIPLQEDNLDYVFDHVESFVCREDVTESEIPTGRPMTLQRDNSLVEACNSLQAKFIEKKTLQDTTTLQHDIQPIGERGDILDYCFEHVETYACGEKATGSLDFMEKTHRGTRTIKTSPSPSPSLKEELEDEVHLYYRPNHVES
jgi:hypothetical protein